MTTINEMAMADSLRDVKAERDDYRQQADEYAAVIVGHESKIAELTGTLDLITADRDHYLLQCNKGAAEITSLDTRIEELQSNVDGLTQAHADMSDDLAEMPRTPDGVLVVLGETVLWRRSCHGELLNGIVTSLSLGHECVLCIASWESPAGEPRGHNMIDFSTCRGSEAELLKAEAKR